MEVFTMAIAADLLQSLVPISQFNKGQAAKIFDRLHSERELIVLKNNQPSAIILSPAEYTRLQKLMRIIIFCWSEQAYRGEWR